MALFYIFICLATIAGSDREAIARVNVKSKLRTYARAAGVTYPPKQLMIRVFKGEKTLEVWGGNSAAAPLKRLASYCILAESGASGPKRQAGDKQVPEGWYHVDRFNPNSAFHLSLGLNYPNASDRLFATAKDPGNDIFIHGNHVSIGCLAMGDPAIEEIYTMARQSKNKIAVLILPRKVMPTSGSNPDHQSLWTQLFAINSAFMRTNILPKVTIDAKGQYHVK